MSFESLINKPMPERTLVEEIIKELQSNYSSYQNKCYFLKLQKVDTNNSTVAWVKAFGDAYAMDDFFYDTVYERTCVLVKFTTQYEILVKGNGFTNNIDVWPQKSIYGREIQISWNVEEQRMISRELLMGAFGEFSLSLKSRKR